jgi:hypothetical protein
LSAEGAANTARAWASPKGGRLQIRAWMVRWQSPEPLGGKPCDLPPYPALGHGPALIFWNVRQAWNAPDIALPHDPGLVWCNYGVTHQAGRRIPREPTWPAPPYLASQACNQL